IEVLPAIARAIAGRVPVLVDGGIRRGTDVLKALASGATAVQVGRPVLWGLAAGGEHGVTAALAMLNHELDIAMALSGCATLAEITGDLLTPEK
ncbi:MAG: alpha-hydroxy-acid oxidizing protein, partial [Chthoniobacterales bacterium]